MRNLHQTGRSPVYSERAMIATSHPLATSAGMDALRRGGTAADAAIAAVAVMSVVEPQMTGIGGDCFALLSKPNSPIWGYNGSGRAAKALSGAMLREQGLKTIPLNSPHSVTVPGAVEAWEAILNAHGKLGLAAALAPAIHYAKNGWVLHSRVAFDFKEHHAKLQGFETIKNTLGKGFVEGDKIYNPALARTLEIISKQGAKGFYEGEVAEDIVSTLSKHGGVMTLQDLASHKGTVEEAVIGSYKGVEVAELPPNGQGITALILLNILENFNIKRLNSAERYHITIEASRLAYAVRDLYISDKATMKVTPEMLTSKAYAKTLAGQIDVTKKTEQLIPKPVGTDTIYMCAVDENGMAISFINSIFHPFGSTIISEKTGVLLQNRGAGFNLTEGHVNELKGGNRPLHTIIPAMMIEKGLVSPFGVMGGAYQATGHAFVVQNMIDYGLDPQAAIDLPRCFFEGEEMTIENTFSPSLKRALTAKGHKLRVQNGAMGGGQIIRRLPSGVMVGGSDCRKDGNVAAF